MPEQKDKSLDDQLKEAEIAKHKAETAKLKAEADLARKQVNAKWYAGKKLAAMATGVLTVVALYGIFDRMFLASVRKQNQTVEQARERLANINARLLDARIDSLNKEQAIISATIDSLKIRAEISAVFGDLDSLAYANVLKNYGMIRENNYFESRLNPEGSGKENDFKVQVVKVDTVIYDAATGLFWQQSGSSSQWTLGGAEEYIQGLNDETFAGYSNWRLPTLEEAMSLMEPKKNEHGLYIDPIFDRRQGWIWTADKQTASRAWIVYFVNGSCYNVGIDFNYNVRAIR